MRKRCIRFKKFAIKMFFFFTNSIQVLSHANRWRRLHLYCYYYSLLSTSFRAHVLFGFAPTITAYIVVCFTIEYTHTYKYTRTQTYTYMYARTHKCTLYTHTRAHLSWLLHIIGLELWAKIIRLGQLFLARTGTLFMCNSQVPTSCVCVCKPHFYVARKKE